MFLVRRALLNKFLRDRAVKRTRELLEKCGIVECDHMFSFQIPGQEEALSYRFSEDIRRRDVIPHEPVSKAGRDRLVKMQNAWETAAGKWNAPVVAKQVKIKGNFEQIHTDLVHILPRFHLPRMPVEMFLRSAEHHNLWDFWTRVLATWFATGHYHAETTAGMLIIVGDMVSEP